MEKIKIGFAGLGDHALQFHLKPLLKIECVEFAGAFEPDIQAFERVEKNYVRHGVFQSQDRHVKMVGKQFHILREVGKQDIFVEVFQLPLRIARQPILDNFLFCFHKSLPLMVYFHRIKEQI
mgnify:CR=1 FL=1